MSTLSQDILYEKKGKVITITLNCPSTLNALSFKHYQYIAFLLEKADADPDSVATVVLGTGKYFSAGADFNQNLFAFNKKIDDVLEKRDFWMNHFLGNNTYFTKAIYNHRKVLVSGLNGSVIGLSAALVALLDLIYAKNDKFFMLLPFANLSLVTEGATATTLFARLGLSKANEALLLSRPLKGQELVHLGFINKVYNCRSTEEFNKQLVADLTDYVENLDPESVLGIKKLIQNNWRSKLVETNFLEGTKGMELFERGAPQKRFHALASKQMKHKL